MNELMELLCLVLSFFLFLCLIVTLLCVVVDLWQLWTSWSSTKPSGFFLPFLVPLWRNQQVNSVNLDNGHECLGLLGTNLVWVFRMLAYIRITTVYGFVGVGIAGG